LKLSQPGSPGAVKRVGQRAFTLIELVISTALMAMILGGAYACLQAGLSTRALVDSREEVLQNARVALSMLSADLRAACPLSKDVEFVGMNRLLGTAPADNLDFATHHYNPRRRGEGDWCEVSYFLDRNPESKQLSLWRRRDPTPDHEPFAGGIREEIAQGLLGLRFEHYDGLDWYQEWGDPDARAGASLRDRPNLAGLPEAVRITLWFDSKPPRGVSGRPPPTTNEPPLIFQTVVRLELAGAAFRGSTGGGNAPGAPQPAPNPGGQP
jgi:type II secretion system protein J